MAENSGGTKRPLSHWQCSECGFEIVGLSALKFCPDCGAKQTTEKQVSSALRCARCSHDIKTPGQRFCEKCCHEQKPGQGQAEREKEPTDHKDRSSGNGGPEGQPQIPASETAPPHDQPTPASLEAGQNRPAATSKGTQEVNKETTQHSPVAKPSPPADPSLHDSEDETQPPPSSQPEDDSSPHQSESPTERDGVSHAPPSSSSYKFPIQESCAQPSAQTDIRQPLGGGKIDGQPSAQKHNGQSLEQRGNGQLPKQLSSEKVPSPQDTQAAGDTLPEQTISRTPAEAKVPELDYSPVFGNQASSSNQNQKKDEEKKQKVGEESKKKGKEKKPPQDISSGTKSGQSEHDPLRESRAHKRESGEGDGGRSTSEQKQPRVQPPATGNVQTNEVTLL